MKLYNWYNDMIFDLDTLYKMIATDRERAEEVFHRSKKLFDIMDEIIENSMDGIYITDGEANAVWINKAFERISGLEAGKLLGRNHRDLEKEGVIARSSAVMAIEQRKTVTIIHEYLPTNKKALVTSIPIFDDAGNIKMVVSNIRDLTELLELRYLAEERKKHIDKQSQLLEQMKAQLIDTTELVAEDKKMLDVVSLAQRMSKVDTTVHICGETGVGKEVIAKYIHKHSPRKDAPFMAVNCGAIPENLVESELFGYEKGAFTGALKEGKIGLIEAADGGTLFLDEVGLLPADVQIKLLRVLQERNLKRVGGTNNIDVDVRVLSATNADLSKMVQEHKFRDDLFYRLTVVTIEIPPLRERQDDIIPLTRYFLDEYNDKYGYNKSFSEMAYQVLYHHKWPGNVRELRNVVERAVVMSDSDVILAGDLPMYKESLYRMHDTGAGMPMKESLERMEYDFICEAYEKFNSVRKAAQYLGMTMSTFVRKKNDYAKKFGGQA